MPGAVGLDSTLDVAGRVRFGRGMSLSQIVSPRKLSRAFAIALALAGPVTALVAAEPALTLKDGDVWVMAGDSITAQRMHTNYIEAYYRTRFPKLHLHFRNSGIGGNRTGSVLARFDYDVAAWKPTIVSVELGMNDVNGPEEAYMKGCTSSWRKSARSRLSRC